MPSSYLSNATTIEVIYSYTIASVVIPVPPLADQNAIMQFLADETAKFDTLTAEASRAIALAARTPQRPDFRSGDGQD